jgi:spermidine synthase
VIGLGVGSIAAYGRPGDRFVFHELDPAVVRVAADDRFFMFLRDSAAEIAVRTGDGRRTIAGVRRGRTDLLVVDAFSSDAIPVHLLTREAVALFRSRLSPDGLIAFHVTNRHLNLSPVVANAAAALDLTAVQRHDRTAQADLADGRESSRWIVVAQRPERLRPLVARGGWQPLRPTGDRVWTDDYSNLLEVLDWSG